MKVDGHADDHGWSLVRLDELDERANHEWRLLSEQVAAIRRQPGAARANVTIEAAIGREPASPIAPAYQLWIADNLAHDERAAEALAAYDRAVESVRETGRVAADLDIVSGALYHKAQSALLAGDVSTAIATYLDLAHHRPADADPFFHAGRLAEQTGQVDRAADFYRRAARDSPPQRPGPIGPAELARRALLRLAVPSERFAPTPELAARSLTDALKRGDAQRLRSLVSTTHFQVGPVGGHPMFETGDVLDELVRDLAESRVTVVPGLFGAGGKRYLGTTGWRGRWFTGDVLFVISRAPRGWECTGVALTAPTELWMPRWTPPVLEQNQPLPFELLAPWPRGKCFAAGGLNEYIVEQSAVGATVAAGAILGGIFGAFVGALVWGAAVLGLAARSCGFGPRGFYYNAFTSHTGEDAFAIDFTSYRQYVPYYAQSAGTPVLAARAGQVIEAIGQFSTGDSDDTHANMVRIAHADPGNPIDRTRFTSSYLHLDGPNKLYVSKGMAVPAGKRLGLMDDTGLSRLNHLHFSVHDMKLPYAGSPGSSFGASVRPTPMSGVTLEDGDSGKCVCSTNIERDDFVINLTTFAGQNWLITPAPRALNQPPPASAADQMFLLVLTGVAIADLKGASASQWRRETVGLYPDLTGPVQYAIDHYGYPLPPGALGNQYLPHFQVEQWAPFAALSSMLNEGESINSGFAVDLWRPNPFATVTDSSGTQRQNIFTGVQVDVAVRDSDAILHRLSYSIVLLGRIVTVENLIL